MPRYIILIPAYNAENSIGNLLDEINTLEIKPSQVIVVDDGSSDKTAMIAEKKDAVLIRLPKNQGKGFALKRGFECAKHLSEIEFILCMDADLQHPVFSIPNFINTANKLNSDFILGNRNKSFKSMPLHRIISNKLTSRIISILTGQIIKDSQCGMRLIRKDILKNIQLSENGFQLESEIIFRIAEQKYRINHVDIPTIYNSEMSNIGNISDTFKFIKLMFKEMIRKIYAF